MTTIWPRGRAIGRTPARVLGLGAAALVVILLAAACGGSPDGPPTAAPETTDTTQQHEQETGDTAGSGQDGSGHHDHEASSEDTHDHDHDASSEDTHDHDHEASSEDTHDHDHEASSEDTHDHDHDHGSAGEPTRYDADLADAVQTITVDVAGGAPVDGVQRVEVELGSVVALLVTSDLTEEVHVHGYDILRPVSTGHAAHFAFAAEIPGVFEVELEGSGRLLLLLEIS